MTWFNSQFLIRKDMIEIISELIPPLVNHRYIDLKIGEAIVRAQYNTAPETAFKAIDRIIALSTSRH
jgi:hypothetical protein